MEMLFDPTRHEPLAGGAWDPDAVRAGIARIVTDTRAAFTPEGLWPIHPDDGPPAWGALSGLYFGAAGVIWALDDLTRVGAVPDGPSFAERLPDIEARNGGFVANFPNMTGGYLLGQSGVLLARWRLTQDREVLDRLADLVSGNQESPALELMWGSPGTVLIAVALHNETGEARWADLARTGATAVIEALHPDSAINAKLWTQDIYGSTARYLGAVHGYAGNAYALNLARAVLEPAVWDSLSADLAETLRASAQRAGDLANWAAKLDRAPDGTPAPLLVQHCHGAAGMVTSLAGLDEDIDDLLVAGGELTWRAGPLLKGSNLCHGTGGNGYAFLKLFERTGEEMWLERARAFAMHALAQSDAQAADLGRRRYSLWTGDLGLARYLWDCLEGRARFPTLDVL
jgi:lantibiotic modifying enzyme